MRRLFWVSLLLTAILAHIAPAATLRKGRATSARKKKAKPAAKPKIDPTMGDNIDGEDLTIRQAAVTALGPVNGSVVVVDPTSGRILTIVNQKLALKNGFIPCSTIKLVTSVAALSEHVIEPDTTVAITRRMRFNLTTALAKSNNQYFARLGTTLGFDRVTQYAQLLGLGEKASLDIPEEQPGVIPAEPPKDGGVGMMTSFGEGFLVTPLELAALVSAIANNGTLYYLQYPKSESEAEQLTPKVKRTLEMAGSGIPDIRVGMRAAVDYGTARRIGYDPDDPIFGKTGTCTDYRASSHMGWFGSFNEVGRHQLVVVVMLTGDHRVSGPVAAGVAGNIYKNLNGQAYFAGYRPAGADSTPLAAAR